MRMSWLLVEAAHCATSTQAAGSARRVLEDFRQSAASQEQIAGRDRLFEVDLGISKPCAQRVFIDARARRAANMAVSGR
jgi:hypothetical protein